MSKALYVSPDRIYLNSRGELCGPKDPDKQRLLVAAGGTLPMEDARRYGLVSADTPALQEVAPVAPSPVPPITVVIDLPRDASQPPTVMEMKTDEPLKASSMEEPKPTAKPNSKPPSKPAPKKK